MARILKSVRWDEDLIKIIESKGKGVDFTDKVHNALYFHFTEEANVKARIKELEQKEKKLKESIAGLETIRALSKNIFLKMGDLLEALGNGNIRYIDNTMEALDKMVDQIKKAL